MKLFDILFRRKKVTEIRENGYLWINRDTAIEKNKDLLKQLPLIAQEELERIKKMSMSEVLKELHMAKTKVKINNVDGKTPHVADGVLLLRAPMPINIPARTKVTVKLGLGVNVPLLIFANANLTNRGLRLANAGAVDANVKLELELENATDSMTLVDTGNVLAKAAVLSQDIDLT